ncbi:MAG: ester cyclase [Chloroflexi bacterium]|nr:ester cyclase [Chloroflexota bacterium]
MAPTADGPRQYIESILARDWEKVKDLLHPEYTYTGSDGKEMAGPGAALAIAQTMTGAFPDLHVETRSVHTAGDVAIAEMVASGAQRGDLMGIAPTGKRMAMPVALFLELSDGSIYREREYFDMMSVLVPLGVVSPPGKA